MKILNVIANPKPENESASKQLTTAFWEAFKGKHEVVELDLYKDPPPYYDYSMYRHFWWPVFVEGYSPTAEEKKAVEYAKRHAELFNAADLLVLTTPMWNFGAPAILKAWMDQILAPGLTFTMGAGGVKPLHKIQKIGILTSSGGSYNEGDPRNALTPQITAAFGFVGIEEVEVVWAEGQNPFFFTDHAERKERAIAEAASLGKKIAAL